MRILVTGGCGFIGSNFIRRLLGPSALRPPDLVVNLDKLTYAGNPENLESLEKDIPGSKGRYRFIRGDIADSDLLTNVMSEGFDGVVNFAAESHVDRSIEGAAPFIHTNVTGVQALLDASRAAGVGRFLQVSTDEVYGALDLESADRFTEQTPLAPNSPYAASKASADLLARAAFVTHRMPVVITRSSNNYGPYQFPEKFLPQMILNAVQDRPLPIYGDGRYVRDWLHVEDHCAALELSLIDGRPGEVYNIGAGAERSNIDLARQVLKLTGRAESLLERVPDRPAHDRRYAVDASRIRRELGWKPAWDLDRGLEATVAWYRDHESWWRRITSGKYLVDRTQSRS